MAKKASFHNFLEHNSDIIAGCESWLSLSIKPAKVFTSGLKICRHDGYGGIFIACQEKLITEKFVDERNIEAVH